MKPVYIGTDLEAMSFAPNYHRWILDAFRPFLGKRLVEVGAGTGSFSALLAETEPESLDLVEPSSMTDRLQKRFTNSDASKMRIFDSLFIDASKEIKSRRPDSIIYVNVLEHIEDDDAELAAVQETLEPGGRIFIFVPAHQWLYGAFDKSVGHFRRYTKPDLERKCLSAGFRILISTYFDLAGIAPWWIKYRLLKSSNLSPSSVRLYDKYIVPLSRRLDRTTSAPTGKNILLIGEKE